MSNKGNRNNYYSGGRGVPASVGSGWKVLSVILALVILAAAVIGIFGSRKDGVWFAESDIAKFFNYWGKGAPVTDGNNPADDDVLGGSFFVNADSESSHGLRLRATGYSLREETYTLRAIKTPADADGSAYVWTVDFVNNAGWGAGKNATDYVTVTPSSEDGAEAVVTCLQPFSARIKVTVALEENPEVSGFATCDYAKKVANVKYEIPNQLTLSGGATSTWTWAPSKDYESDIQDWAEKRGSASIEWTEGNLDSNVEAFTMTVKCSEQLKEQLDKINISDSDRADYRKTLSYYDLNRIGFSQGALFFAGGNNPFGLLSFCGEAYDQDVDQLNTTNFKALRTALQACSMDFVITITITPTYGNDYVATYNVNVDDASIRLLPNGVAPDKPGIIF